MLKTINLPENLISGAAQTPYLTPEAKKCTLDGIDEIQCLSVSPWTSIKKHSHDNQWEVWIRISKKIAYICLKNEEHELVNNSGSKITLMAIKGHVDYSYDELYKFLSDLGFSIEHGSLIVNP